MKRSEYMAKRSRGYYRAMREKTINRKRRIINSYRLGKYVTHDGTLSKGKIHCSCEMCSFHGTSRQDTRKLIKMEDALTDLYYYPYIKSISSSSILPLKNKICKDAKGRYYPKRGFKGTRLSANKKLDISEFQKVIYGT